MGTPLAEHFLQSIALRREWIKSFEEYPFSLPAVRGLHSLEFHPQVTFIVGENGTGKSTLMEAVAVALGLNPEGGSRNFRFKTRESHSTLDRYLHLKKGIISPRDRFFLRAESLYNLATEIEKLDEGGGGQRVIEAYGGKSLHEQSHGESFYAVFVNRFGDRGLYLLDEPEAALSPVRQLGFLTLMNDLVRSQSQFVIATHSPIILAYPEAWIYLLDERGITRTTYEETEHYRVTKQFLDNPARMLKVLFEP